MELTFPKINSPRRTRIPSITVAVARSKNGVAITLCPAPLAEVYETGVLVGR